MRESGASPGWREGPAAREWPVALASVLLCGFSYLLVAGGFSFRFPQTDFPHHVFMADAMLHGQLHIRPEVLEWKERQVAARIKEATLESWRGLGMAGEPSKLVALAAREAKKTVAHDWTVVDGRNYGYWGPLIPAATLPFVALLGHGASDRLVSVFYGTLNVALFWWLLARLDATGLLRATLACRAALTLVFGLGTTQFWMVCSGQIWFAVQIISLSFALTAMAFLFPEKMRARHALLGGVFFGLSCLGLPVMACAGLFFLSVIAMRGGGSSKGTEASGFFTRIAAGFRPALPRLLLFCLPLAAAAAAQLWYNHARFGGCGESGLGLQIATGANPRYKQPYSEHGLFSPHYLPHNAKHYFLNADFPENPPGTASFDPEGNSVFIVTPILLYVFLAWRAGSPLGAALAAGTLPMIFALLCFLGTGWVQFGPRHLLDAMPMLLALSACGMKGRLGLVSFGLCLASFAMQLYGASRMLRPDFGPFFHWIQPLPLAIAVGGIILLVAAAAPLRARFLTIIKARL